MGFPSYLGGKEIENSHEMKERMQGHRLAIRPEPPKEFMGNGLRLASPKYGELTKGEIVNVGTGIPGHPIIFGEREPKAGEFVTFRTTAAMKIKFNDEELWCVDAHEVFIHHYDDADQPAH